MTCKRVLLYIFYIFFLLVGIIFIICGGLFFTSKFNIKGECTPFGSKPIRVAHRGNTTIAQENTIESTMSAVANGYVSEIDINQISTGEFVLFHDDNALELTGTNLDIESATLDQFKALTYLTTLNNYTYSSVLKPPLFSELLTQVCGKYPNANLDFDIKFSIDDSSAKSFFELLDSSPCSCKDGQMIFATPYFYQINSLRKYLDKSRCKGHIALWHHPDTYPLGEYFWLKTRFGMWIGKPDTVTAYYKIWEAHPDLLEGFNNDGFCTGVYNEFPEIIDKYNASDYRIYDISSESNEKYDYTPNTSVYAGLIVILIIGVLLTVIFFILILLTCCNCICKANNNNNNTVNSSVGGKVEGSENANIV